jgi:hypothetical protein
MFEFYVLLPSSSGKSFLLNQVTDRSLFMGGIVGSGGSDKKSENGEGKKAYEGYISEAMGLFDIGPLNPLFLDGSVEEVELKVGLGAGEEEGEEEDSESEEEDYGDDDDSETTKEYGSVLDMDIVNMDIVSMDIVGMDIVDEASGKMKQPDPITAALPKSMANGMLRGKMPQNRKKITFDDSDLSSDDELVGDTVEYTSKTPSKRKGVSPKQIVSPIVYGRKKQTIETEVQKPSDKTTKTTRMLPTNGDGLVEDIQQAEVVVEAEEVGEEAEEVGGEAEEVIVEAEVVEEEEDDEGAGDKDEVGGVQFVYSFEEE